MYARFAWRYFKGKKSANAINIIAWVTTGVIAFATCCQVLVLSVFNGFEGLVKSLYGAFYTDMKVVPASGKTMILTPQLIQQIKKIPGIEGISLIAEEKALLKLDESQSVAYIKGVDDQYAKISGVPGKLIQGSFNTGTTENPTLIAGIGIQYATGMRVNENLGISQLTLFMPKKSFNNSDPFESMSEGHVQAAGIFAIQQDFDNKYAFTNIGFTKQLMGLSLDEYTAAEIKLSNPEKEEQVLLELKKLLGTNYKAQTKYEQNSNLYQTMQMEKWAIFAVLTLILIIAAFNMISALSMLVLEKKQDIAILKSMGANSGQIRKIFLSEGFLLAILGAGSGILLALLICFLQVKFKLIKLQGGSFLIDYFPVKVSLSDLFFVAVTALVIALFSAWFPAKKAADQSIILK